LSLLKEVMAYNPRDKFFLQAKKDGYRARSAYKLVEMQQRFKLLKSGDRVLDLGAAPGGFCQIAAAAVGPKGYVLGVDLEPIPGLPPPVETWVADAFTPELLKRLRKEGRAPYDAVLSDLAPKTSGVHGVDEARSLGLAERALDLSLHVLRPGGTFVVKLFMGAGFEQFRAECRKGFGTVRVVKPEASVARRSKELYLVCTGGKPIADS
jgi:23S rRNA (uridine2552-2'-O)-methyltransferase